MTKVKDGFWKQLGSKVGSNDYLLKAAGGYIGVGNNSGEVVPLNNSTKNEGLNADMVDGLHTTNLVKFYLSPLAGSAPASSAKSWFENTMPSGAGAIVYNVPGSEKTIIVGKSTGAYGHMLQLNYDDKYLRILRYYAGNWKSDDWEKISAGYADSAGYSEYTLSLNSTVLPSSTSNAANTVWCKFATITFNASAWCNAAGYIFFSGGEASDYKGILEYHFRAGQTASELGVAQLSWITKSHDYATVIAVKTANNVYDFYTNNCSSWSTPRIYHFSAYNDRFKWNVGSWSTTKPTAAYTASDIGRVYYSTNAGNANYAIEAGTASSAGSVAWANITGKPSTFTPSSHTHPDTFQISNEENYINLSFRDAALSQKASEKYIECWDGAGGWWNWKANKWIKVGSDDSYVLLGGGGHKLISDFATAEHTHYIGNKPASDLSSTYPQGISVGGIYANGYPFQFGSTITAYGSGGYFQIAGQWNSDVTGDSNYDFPTEMYIRGRRDSYDVWTTWTRVLTDRNYTNVLDNRYYTETEANNRFVNVTGDTMTGLLTTASGSSHNGIKVGDTYINAIDGNLIFQNNSAIRFGGDSWDWNIWAGLKYEHSSKTIYLGLAGNSVFTTNSDQSGGTLNLSGIYNISSTFYNIKVGSIIQHIPATSGWYTIAQVSGYFNYDLYITGGWYTGMPSTVRVNICNINGTTKITQFAGYIGNHCSQIRLGQVNTDVWDVQLYINGQTDTLGDQKCIFTGYGGLTVYNTSAASSTSYSVTNTLAFGQISGISLTSDNYTSYLDGRYYTETEADNRFVNITGDTMSGRLNIGVESSGNANPLCLYHSNIRAVEAKGKSVGIRLGHDANSYYARIAAIFESQNPDYLRPGLAFYTMDSTYQENTESERMRISAAGNVGIGTTTPGYKLTVSGDSYTTGWSRAANGFYVEGNGVHFTHQGSVGEIDMTSNNEFLWGSSSTSLYFNYRTVSRGTTVNNYIWNAGSSTSWASHNMGNIWLNGSGVYLRLGPQNSSHAHYDTNASVSHWFNKRVDVNGDIWRYGTNYGIASDGQFYAKAIYANRDGASTYGGISLYSTSDPITEYGIAFRGTGNYGKIGRVQGDWATYFTMDSSHNRGWIFRSGGTNYASVSARGEAYFNSVGTDNYIAYPSGGFFSSDGSTGYIIITIPANYRSCTMMRFNVEIYNYSTGTSTTYTIGGYNYDDGNWYNVFAYANRQGTTGYGNLTVRFGHNGTNSIIWIGESNTSYSYPKVRITNVTLGHSNIGYNTWASGWSVTIATTAPTNVSQTVTNPATNYYAESAGSAGYANNSDKLDNIDSTGFLRWKCMANIGSSSPFQNAVDYFNNLSNLNNGATMVYNYAGAEYTELFTRRNDSTGHGSILKWGYPDNYIRMIRMISGSPQTSDWEKISAGYADSAGNADTVDNMHASNFSYNVSSDNYDCNNLPYGTHSATYRFSGSPLNAFPNSSWSNMFVIGAGSDTMTQIGAPYNVDELYFRRGTWYSDGGSIRTNAWNAILHSGNYTSYVNNYYWANVKISTSSNTGTYPTFANMKSTGRVYLDEWIQFSGSSGLYWPNTNGAHLYANTTTSYAALITQGSRGGYCGLQCGPSANYMTVMSTDTHHGLYCENTGTWEFYYNRSNDSVGIRTSSNLGYDINLNGSVGSNSSISGVGFVHTSYNSASYLLTSNGGVVNESKYLKNFGSSNYVTFTVGGDANTYYPVRIHNPADYYPYSFITISRAYYETAPDTWYTSTHKGGLSMCLFWNSSSYWDGNSSGGECFCVRLNETYCNMVAGMDSIIDGTVVWLRGGGATYHIHGIAGTSQGVTVYLESYTDHASRTFSPRTWEQRTPVSVRWPGYANGADYAPNAGSVAWSNVTGKPFNWSGQSGQPTWLWGSNDGTNYYVWNPSNFSVNYANSAGSADYADSAESATQATNLTPENTAHYFRNPNDSTWRGGMIWGSAGSESMSFVVANSGTRFQFVGGSDIASWTSGTWQSANPYLTIYSNGIVTPGSATASEGFIKSGYDNTYVLLAGGGHKAESDLSVSYASSAGSVAWANITGKPFNWSGQSGQPSWLWGSNDGTNYYVWDPSNFSVNYADSAGSAERARYLTCPDTRSLAPAPGDYTATSTGVSFDFKESSVTGLSGYSGVMTFRPYASAQDWTGGEVHQIAFLAGGGLYHRIGTSSWDSWERILTSSNWSSYISIPSVGNDTNYYPIRSYTSGLQISSYSGSTDCALFVPYATANQAGVVSTETQTFSGQKTFSSIRLRSTDTVNFGGYLYFGDGSYAYLAELADDQLTLNASKIFLGISGSQKYYIDGTIFRPVTANSTSDSGIALGSSDYRFTCGYFSDKVYAYKGFYESSDERLKRILNSVKVNLDDLSKLRKVYYLWKDRTEDGIQLGMIAQDVQRLYPELVSVDKETGYLSLAYDKLSVLALEAIDVLYKEHKKLKKHVDELEKLLINNKIY